MKTAKKTVEAEHGDWLFLVFDEAIPHLCPKSRTRVVQDNMLVRGSPLISSRPCKDFSIDFPGMVAIDRPIETFNLFGLKVEIPSEDIASFIEQLESLEPRMSNPDKASWFQYYKLHGFLRAWVLTPSSREELLKTLKGRLQTAELRSKVFYFDRKLPSQVLREAAAKASGQPIENIPDLGGHKVDRFVNMKRGQA